MFYIIFPLIRKARKIWSVETVLPDAREGNGPGEPARKRKLLSADNEKIFDLAYDAVNADQVVLLEAELLKDILNSPSLRLSSQELTNDAIERVDRMMGRVRSNWEALRKIMKIANGTEGE